MRWMWIDRFIEFEHGRRAVALKNVSLAEEQIDDYFPGFPVMPSSLIVEGVAQTGGLLVAEYYDFGERVVLAKVGRAVFHFSAVPGDSLVYTATAEYIQPDGAMVRGTCHVGDRLQAEMELVFAHLDERFEGVDLFYPADFLQMMRIFGLFDVGRNADGTPLTIPAHLLAAEALANATGLD